MFSDEKTRAHIRILAIIFLLFFIVQAVIESSSSLPEKDPYNWFSIIMYLNKYGDLNYEDYTVHGIGFAFYIAACLLITNNFYLQYYFIKYVSSFFFSIIIMTVYEISSKKNKKNYEILITLTVLLCFNSLLFRFSLAVPSILATTLSIIFINTFFHKEELKIFVIRGFMLAGIFLSHPLYFLLLFGYLILFELVILFNNLIKKLEINEAVSLNVFENLLKRNGIPLLVAFIISIPYFLNLFLHDTPFLVNFTRYLYRGYSAKIQDLNKDILIYISKEFFILELKPSTTNVFYNLIFFGLDIPINKTLNWGVIFLVIGILFNTKLPSKEKNYIIGYIRFTFLITFIIFILNSFLFVTDNNFVLSIASFINQYGKRLFELFAPIWSILFILGVIKIIELIKKSEIKYFDRNSQNKEDLIKKKKKKYEKLYFVILILLGISLYSSHLYFQYNVIYTSQYDDEYLTDALLFIGDYFNAEDIEDKTILLPDNFDSKVIYRLIYHKDCDRDYLEFDNTNYTELTDSIEENNADFVLVYKLETTESCLEKIDEREDILYENRNYIFFKT
jgi:hypothetical protein